MVRQELGLSSGGRCPGGITNVLRSDISAAAVNVSTTAIYSAKCSQPTAASRQGTQRQDLQVDGACAVNAIWRPTGNASCAEYKQEATLIRARSRTHITAWCSHQRAEKATENVHACKWTLF